MPLRAPPPPPSLARTLRARAGRPTSADSQIRSRARGSTSRGTSGRSCANTKRGGEERD